jgi:uncharacterized protein (TIGR04222 family)
MNIFDMRGPEFLALYLFASVVGLIGLYVMTKRAASQREQPSADARRLLRDPYLLAFLRGGAKQTLQTVAFSLSERGLLSFSNKRLQASGGQGAAPAVTQPLEVAVLVECASPRGIGKLLGDKRLKAMAEDLGVSLKTAGLLADAEEYSRRLRAFLAIVGTLLAVAVIKLNVALEGGHTNIGGLVVLALIVLVAGIAMTRRRRTAAGNRALADQQTLFAQLRGRVKTLEAGGATNEAVYIAAAFGLAALPGVAYPFADSMQRESQAGGAGCGAASGGGGGGGDGGAGCGGCGGGCGGG